MSTVLYLFIRYGTILNMSLRVFQAFSVLRTVSVSLADLLSILQFIETT